MNRKAYYLGLVVVLVIILGGAGLLLTQKPAKDDTRDTVSTSTKTGQQNTKDAPQAQQSEQQVAPNTTTMAGLYTGYSEQAFADAAKQTRVLFFHAPWCPQCRALDESIKSQELPDNTVIFKVDYDTNQVLRQKYGVTLQTTLVKVDEKGEKVKSVVAYNNPVFSAVKPELGL